MAKGYSVANLGITIESNATNAVNSVKKLIAVLDQATQSTYKLSASMALLANSSPQINVVNNVTNNITNNMKKATDATDKFKKSLLTSSQIGSGSLSGVLRSVAVMSGFGSVQQTLGTLYRVGQMSFKNAIDFVENYNLFNVSFAGNVEEALGFQYKLNAAFKTNISETMRYQGIFNNLSRSLGITNESSSMLSRNLTKLAYDLASLYNIDINTSASKIQSGLIGQTKPLRSLGIDVTQQSLQPWLYEVGVQKQVTELTQAEKVLLRYYAILKQSTSAQGDFARSIESPANQLKILKDQLAELTRWFGTLFMGTFSKILPYVNAFVITIKEVLKSFAMLFGFNLEDYNFLKPKDGLEELDDAILGATDSSESLKKSLYGFDELNLAQSASSGNSVFDTFGKSATYTALEEAIMAMGDYENGMEGVRMKATEVADQLLKWLGYTTDGEANITGIEGGLAKIASLSFEGVTTSLKWIKDNGWAVDLVLGAIIGRILFLVADKMILGIMIFIEKVKDIGLSFTAVETALKAMNIPLLIAQGGFMALGLAIVYLADNWGKMSELERLETILYGIAGAATAAALGIGAVFIAGTSGAAAIPIIAGLTAFGAAVGLVLGTYKATSGKDLSGNKGSGFNLFDPKYSGSVSLRADGGFPSVGEMFIARESGAEMVGTIGGRTAVANNDQIVAGIKQGVKEAILESGSNGGSVNIYLDDVMVGSALIDTINKSGALTGKTVTAW